MQNTQDVQNNYYHHDTLEEKIAFLKDDIGIFILRLAVGGLMLFHGMNKMMSGPEAVNQMLSSVGVPAFLSFGVFLGEVVGPIMLILGFKVRVGAFLVAVDMLMAILLVHSGQLTQVNEAGGWMIELNALYLLGAIAILFIGSGHIALTRGKGALD